VLDTDRGEPGFVVGGAGVDGVGVEHHQVGDRPEVDRAAVCQTEAAGGARGEVADALLQAEHPEFAHVVA
jgi:hypothetical protein